MLNLDSNPVSLTSEPIVKIALIIASHVILREYNTLIPALILLWNKDT